MAHVVWCHMVYGVCATPCLACLIWHVALIVSPVTWCVACVPHVVWHALYGVLASLYDMSHGVWRVWTHV